MSFEIPKEPSPGTIRTVKIGATSDEGGTRKSTVIIGGATALPFHFFEGNMPHKPAIAMEVFDSPPNRYPAVLRNIYNDVIDKPGEMAKKCVNEYGAQLISVRLEGTHPDKGDKSPDAAVEVVKEVLGSISVPLIITGHANFEKNNEVIRKVTEAAAGENCLINWVEKDNYKTVAACCLAHGHCVVAQSPIDVNIAKQLNIQLTDMSFPADKIVIDPLTSAVGYGFEYTYSIMERIRLDGLIGDDMLRMPMMITPGCESALAKEAWAPETSNPEWGSEELRTTYWEITTAFGLLFAGAELIVMYHPKATEVLRKKIDELFAGNA
jgi:acetyl-CoA decarbonylase/synthase complex subunit delta